MKSLYDILACPVCKIGLLRKGESLRCPECRQAYPIINGVPVIFPGGEIPAVQHEDELVVQSGYYPWLHRVILQSLLDDQVAVDVGCGNMGFDDPGIIRMDVTLHPYADLVGDIHALPFLPGSVAAFFSLAVVEHLRQPFQAAHSMYEALKDGGYIYHECNFVFAYHGYPHHYFNATLQGMQQIFAQFRPLRTGVAPYQMPSFAIQMLLDTYLRHTRARDYQAGRLWAGLLEKVLQQNSWWYDHYFEEAGALNVAAGTYFCGQKQAAPGATLIPAAIREVWQADPRLQERFPDINHLATSENILIWSMQEGRQSFPTIDRYLKGLTPFNKRGPETPWDRSTLRSWPLVEPVFGAHPQAQKPDLASLARLAGGESVLQEQEQTIQALRSQLQEWELRWQDQERSIGWKLLQNARRLRLHIAPPGSRRDRLVRLPFQALRLLRAEGLRELLRRTYARTRPPGGDRPLQIDQPAAAPLPLPEQLTDPYQAWIAEYEPTVDELVRQRMASAQLANQPLISIILLLPGQPDGGFRHTLASVQAQTYPRWEICIAGDPEQLKEARSAIEGFPGRLHTAAVAAGVGLAARAALGSAAGEFVILLDPGDRLAPGMLSALVEALGREPAADLVYCDEDRWSADGAGRHSPFFKPDWSPELLLSVNYLAPLVVRRSLLEQAGGFDPAMEAAQTGDLALRCSEIARQVLHIPQVLYHRPSGAGPARPELHCLEAHLQRLGVPGARAVQAVGSFAQVIWPAQGGKVSIVIPTKNKPDVLRTCLDSLFNTTTYPNYEVILVDNGSTDPQTLSAYAALRLDPRIQIVDFPHPFNYSAANNLGARHAGGEFLLFLNNDIEIIEPGWLEELVRWAERPEIGAVGAKLLSRAGRIQHAGVVMGMGAYAGHIFLDAPDGICGPFGSVDWYRDYTAVTAACMLMRRTVFEAVGGFDEKYILALSDVEICLRIRKKGFRNLYTPHARLIHDEGQTRSGYIPAEDLIRGYLDVKQSVINGDPFYNPNLSYAGPIPTLLRKAEITRLERLNQFFKAYGVEGFPAGPA